MFKGFFFNALPVDGQYDRKYNADDYSNALRVIVGNGIVHFDNGQDVQVVCSNDNTAQTLTSSATSYGLKIRAGYGWINGKSFNNDAEFAGEVRMYNSANDESIITLSSIQLPQKFYKRIDRVVVRRDDSPNVRDILPILLRGNEVSEGIPQPLPINFASDNGTDLCLAEILVDNTGDLPIITVYDKRADATACGWVNGYFGDNWEQYCETINTVMQAYVTGKTDEFNRWFDEVRESVATVTMLQPIYNLVVVGENGTAAGSTFPIGITTYDKNIDVIDVYTNGFIEEPNGYTISSDSSSITFVANGGGTGVKTGGTRILFKVTKSIDARVYDNPDTTVIASINSQITDLYNKIDDINEYTYYCTGNNDNIAISDMVKAFMSNNLTDNARLKINVRGNFGATNPYKEYANANNIDNYARWFDFSTVNNSNRRVVLDFSNCSPINITLANNTSNIIFYGANQDIENCILKAGSVSNTGTKILAIFGRSDVQHKECKYSFICDQSCDFTRHGKFDNCEVTLISKSGNATAFYTDPVGSICDVDKGIYFLYVGKDVDSSTYGTKLVYYNRGKSFETDAPDYSQVTILRNVLVPSYTNATLNGVNYFLVDGMYFKQDGAIFKSLLNAGGFIRSNNIITASGRMANDDIDASTNSIIEGTIPRSRGIGQTPFV